MIPSATSECGSPREVDWIIDPFAGSLLSKSAEAAALLGPHSNSQREPQSLDRAMPALAELRTLLACGTLTSDPGSIRDLLFWTADGARVFRCACRTLPQSGATTKIAVSVLRQSQPTEFADGRSRGDASRQPEPGGNDEMVATLDKIARRIRAELAARASSLEDDPEPRSEGSSDAQLPPELAPHLAELAHELRTPLSAIAAMSEIMRDERFGRLAIPKYVEYARSIHDSARHLLSLVEGMLDREAIVSGRPPLTFVQLDVGSLVASTVEALQPIAAAAGVRLSVKLAAGLPHLIADQRSVRQILLNLLTNALKFTPVGGSVRVSAEATQRGLIIEVADTGPGISADKTHLAGDGAVAAAATTTTFASRTSSGLGLPLVHALAAANGAQVDLVGEAGRGTRATICFPQSRLVPV